MAQLHFGWLAPVIGVAVPPVPASTTSAEPTPLPLKEVQRQARRTRRQTRYEEVLKLREQGASQRAIADLLGLHRDTVRRYLAAPAFPEIVRPKRKSLLDPPTKTICISAGKQGNRTSRTW